MGKVKAKLWTNQYLIIILLSLVMFASFYMITAGFPIFVSTISDNPAIAGIMTTTLMVASLHYALLCKCDHPKSEYEIAPYYFPDLFFGHNRSYFCKHVHRIFNSD